MQPVWLCILSGCRPAIWRYIWKLTLEKSKMNAARVTLPVLIKAGSVNIWDAQWRKVKQMQAMWLCIISSWRFEETFVNTRWRKDRQTMQLCMLHICVTENKHYISFSFSCFSCFSCCIAAIYISHAVISHSDEKLPHQQHKQSRYKKPYKRRIFCKTYFVVAEWTTSNPKPHNSRRWTSDLKRAAENIANIFP